MDKSLNELLYEMIFKRRSFHMFGGAARPSAAELQEIEEFIPQLRPLVPGIRTAFRIVPRQETNCRVGEYCILIYSEHKGLWEQNAGYLGQQLDLWLASRNIGVCWHGLSRPAERQYQGLHFVIMLAIATSAPEYFRPHSDQARRKSAAQIWQGDDYAEVAETVRLAPSAVNRQPWLVKQDGTELRVYRLRAKYGPLLLPKSFDYTQIDIGIFLLILELCLEQQGLTFTRKLYAEKDGEQEHLTALYRLR